MVVLSDRAGVVVTELQHRRVVDSHLQGLTHLLIVIRLVAEVGAQHDGRRGRRFRPYEAHVIEMSDGQSVMGVIKSHTAEGLLVVDVAGQERTVPHANIVADTTLSTSLMPMGLDGTLTEQELCDLVAWLRSLK